MVATISNFGSSKKLLIGLVLLFSSLFFIDIYSASRIGVELSQETTVKLLAVGHMAVLIPYFVACWLITGQIGNTKLLGPVLPVLFCVYYNISDEYAISIRLCDTFLYFLKFYFAFRLFKFQKYSALYTKVFFVWLMVFEGYFFFEVCVSKVLFYLEVFGVVILPKISEAKNLSIFQRFFGEWFHWAATIVGLSVGAILIVFAFLKHWVWLKKRKESL